MPSAPLGGRLREADTRPCLVVSPVFVAGRQKAQTLSDLGLAEGASHECAETRAFRASGARSRGQFRRAIAPDRGLSRPRTAPNNCECARATLCCFETAIAVGSILGERITPKPDQRIQGSSAHVVYSLAFVCTYQAIEIQLLNACLASVLLS